MPSQQPEPKIPDEQQPLKEFEVVVVGSGFAGAVTACRLAQAGFNICLLERGRRYESGDFPAYPTERRVETSVEKEHFEPPRDLARWLWQVDQGIYDIKDLNGISAVMAAGYGGGSLLYASVHLRAPKEVFESGHWPQAYTRKQLDPYYDLVAYMLDVSPFPHNKYGLAKTHQLRRAGQKGNWFLPPLAVNFARSGKNKHGVWQGACDLRGYCCLGCGAGAKNSLDFNYLHLAELQKANARGNKKQKDLAQNVKALEVRTLSEVRKIYRDKKGKHPFKLLYYDYLERREDTIAAKYVFLCAGAVNTTDLMFRSYEELFPEAKQDDVKKRLGSRYFPNADSLATVFDCDSKHEVDYGPTITSSLAYDMGKEWFLIQDGGVPNELEGVLGVFRSPLWLRRNRYLETPDARSGVPAFGLRSGADTRVKYGQFQHRRQRGLRETLAVLPPRSAGQFQHARSLRTPPWFDEAIGKIREQVLDNLSVTAEPVAQQVLDELARLLEPRVMELAQVAQVGNVTEMLAQARQLGVTRGLLRLGAQLLWGSESDAVRHALNVVLQQVPRDTDQMARRLLSVLEWAANNRPGNGQTALLLTMGRDMAPGQLYMAGNSEDWYRSGVKAELNEVSQAPLRSAQELALRDIAKTWGGELRTNPFWAFAKRRVTVHSQGGCPMGPGDPAVAAADEEWAAADKEYEGHVTDDRGEVLGCSGLYIMDAAAFPAAVGVNPAPTIAAIAEYKIKRFINEVKDANWEAPETGEAKKWAEARCGELDPMRSVRPRTNVDSKPIGLRFSEKMQGHCIRVRPPPRKLQLSSFGPSTMDFLGTTVLSMSERLEDYAIDREVLQSEMRSWMRAHEVAEMEAIRFPRQPKPPGVAPPARKWIPEAAEIELDCTATLDDLATFLETREAGKVLKIENGIELTGNVLIDGQKCPITEGKLHLFTTGDRIREKNFRYDVKFEFCCKKYQLIGLKAIFDDPTLDVWTDTATLSVDIDDLGGSGQRWTGILRLPASEFLNEVIQSFEILNTDDPDRKVWAMTAFCLFFFGHLVESYLPEARLVPEFLKNLVRRTHG